MAPTVEHRRLEECRFKTTSWRKWGPYLSERQWGTVREDYSTDGNAWDYFTHDQSRSRTYRWGEDGLGGISDNQQNLCFALALWNGQDPIIKERIFGLTNSEGNHGEDAKDYYYYLDSTPTHSYMKFLYKYPHAAFPYDDLVATNRRRTRKDMEYELIDSGVFNEDRYFDVFIEYAKRTPEDILIQISIHNLGPNEALLHILPTLWFRNTWSWGDEREKPMLCSEKANKGSIVHAYVTEAQRAASLSDYFLYCDKAVPLLFTENETNNMRLFKRPNASDYVKDGINDYVVHGRREAVNPLGKGTKVSAHYQAKLQCCSEMKIRLRLSRDAPGLIGDAFSGFDRLFNERKREADEFYEVVTPASVRTDPDRTNVMRQALAGMLWSKQYYYFDADVWLEEHHAHPLRRGTNHARNREWFHMVNSDVISMPDKWEYPWYAAWDLAFHTIALSVVDPDFARDQLKLLLSGHYLHPNGQVPAYEWNFSDVNPPVHAWATVFLHRLDVANSGAIDIEFLKAAFSKLTLNFTWWVNRKDRHGKNVFEGGFLGLDNIGVFDRSASLPGGGYLEQADATAWMALFSQNMAELATELALHDAMYDEMAGKFLEHFLWIAAGMNSAGSDGMWDDEDGFYYDLLRSPDGSASRLKVRSLVGLLPLCATTITEPWQRERLPRTRKTLAQRAKRMPELFQWIHPTGDGHLGVKDRGILAMVNPERLRRILTIMLDENEFLGPYGLRSISKYHERNPYIFHANGSDHRIDYLPAESDTGMFGGNSNWRGPVWFPINLLIIRALGQFYLYYGDGLKIECPTGSGRLLNLFDVAKEISERLISIFLRNNQGRRPVFGGIERFQCDDHWRNNILFYEYFHGDNGAGLGASHQTGWTGCVAKLIELFGHIDSETILEGGKRAAFHPNTQRS